MRAFMDIDRCIYLHLSEDEITEFMKQIEEGFKQPNKSLLFFH